MHCLHFCTCADIRFLPHCSGVLGRIALYEVVSPFATQYICSRESGLLCWSCVTLQEQPSRSYQCRLLLQKIENIQHVLLCVYSMSQQAWTTDVSILDWPFETWVENKWQLPANTYLLTPSSLTIITRHIVLFSVSFLLWNNILYLTQQCEIIRLQLVHNSVTWNSYSSSQEIISSLPDFITSKFYRWSLKLCVWYPARNRFNRVTVQVSWSVWCLIEIDPQNDVCWGSMIVIKTHFEPHLNYKEVNTICNTACRQDQFFAQWLSCGLTSWPATTAHFSDVLH